jgi:hypothetical protein
MEPEQPLNPSQPTNAPQIYGPSLPNANPTGLGGSAGPTSSKRIKKLPLIIVGVVAVIFVILIIVAVIVSRKNGDNKNPTTDEPTTEHLDPEGPQPATALDVEQTNNSITQDITGLNDDKEFPPEQLSDDSLDL